MKQLYNADVKDKSQKRKGGPKRSVDMGNDKYYDSMFA